MRMLSGFRFPRWAKQSERRNSRPRRSALGRLGGHHRRLLLESLEDRRLLSTVTDSSDSASDPNSLRYQILNDAAGSTIQFDSSLAGQTIGLTNGVLEISKSLTIEGLGAGQLPVTVNANSSVWSSVFQVDPSVTASISDLTITGGHTPVAGGGSGGGIYDQGNLTLANCTVSGNTADSSGGGIYVDGSAGATLAVTGCTFSANGATTWGGGIDYLGPGGSLTATNCTFSGNSAGDGGGIYAQDGATTVTNCTIDGNSALNDGGGICESFGTLTLNNTIVAGNAGNTTSPDIYGTVTTVTPNHCLIGDNTGSGLSPAPVGTPDANGNMVGTQGSLIKPSLDSLGNYGGLTDTLPLLFGSPAIDAGSVSLIPSGVNYDQRGAGFSRTETVNVKGTPTAEVDIGAVQYQPVVTSISPAKGFASGDTAVTIKGMDLTEAKEVDFGTTPATDVTSSATEITATSPASAGGVAGPVDVTVVTPFGTSATSPPADQFTYVALPALSIGDVTLAEGDSGTKTFNFTVSMSGSNTLGASVSYATADGSTNPATAGSDYVATSGTLTWAAGDTSSQTISVTVNGDTTVEPDETFYVNLSSPTNATLSKSQGVGTIQNDDIALGITATDATKAEGNSGTTPFTFTVSRSGLTTGATTVNYAVTGSGTNPANGADFGGTLPSGQVSFAAGDKSETLTINVSGDLVVEPDEGFTVTLSGASGNAQITTPTATGTILNDDSALPALSIGDVTLAEGDSGTKTFNFTVSMSGSNTLGASVSYATANGSTNPATAGSDYVATSGTLTWAAGDTSSQTISVTVNGDTTVEPDETFYVNLSSPTNATLSKSQGVGTIQNDDIALGITATDATKAEGNSGTTPFTFTVSRSGLTTGATTVNYAVTGSGTNPANGADFGGTLPSGQVSFAAGDKSETLTINVSGDLVVEPDEGFTVTLSGASGNAQITTPTATGTILNDDLAQVADLTLSKTHSGSFRQGDAEDAYTITVLNAGPGPTTGSVTVNDVLPTGLTPTAADSGTINGWSVSTNGQTVTATRSNVLAAGGSYPALTLMVAVASNAPASVTNTATVSGGGEIITTNDSATDLTSITQVADLTLTKTHTGSFRQGDAGDAYTITVSNAGPGPTTGSVTVSDVLPTGLTPTAADSGTINGWSVSTTGQTVTATRSNVLSAATSYPALTVRVNVASTAPASVTNTATVSGGGEINTANDTASDLTTIIQLLPDLTLSKSHIGSFEQGDTGDTYTIIVSNAGPGPTTSQVTVTDVLPTGLTPTAADSGTINGWTVSTNGQTVTATRSDTLATGANYTALTVMVDVASDAPTSVTNTATLAGGGEANTANDTASDPTNILAFGSQSTLSIQNSGPKTLIAGQTASYTVTVSNSGPADAQNVVLTESLPGDTFFGSESHPAGCTWTDPQIGSNGGCVTCCFASLPAGASASFTFLATTDNSLEAAKTITNNATVASRTDATGSHAATTNTAITLTGVTTQADSFSAGKTDLVIGGTNRGDSIYVLPVGSAVLVLMNGSIYGPFHPTGRILAFGRGGNDTITVSPAIALPSLLFGGSGNDMLYGGSGNNILDGGDGNDRLVAGRGRNIMVGGQGSDWLLGLQGQNLEIAGSINCDCNQVALNAILNEWAGSSSYMSRVTQLRGTAAGGANQPFCLNSASVQNDAARDYLFGGMGQDWYMCDSSGIGTDYIFGKRTGECVDPM